MDRSIARPAEMAKAYEPQQVEQRLYAWWEEQGFFEPRADASKEPFVISIPPPNVTGELHLGHAMFVTIEDILIRWRRMQGHAALWLPGTDHAGIATQSQVEKLLISEGTSRQEVGRDEFLRRTWEWKEKYGGEITSQLRRLGASCDWSRERFTLDAGLSRSVHTAFKKLYDDGLIYRGKRLVNWSPKLGTAVSDLEVEYETRQGSIWYVRYPLESDTFEIGTWGTGSWAASATEYITVATTRPETILGDTAIAVNPEDERFAHLIGRYAVLPALGRRIPIVADSYVDKEFGSGAVKITPAHDPNDYELGRRHNLPMINIMNLDATINGEGGIYVGQDRFEARKNLVKDLELEGLLVKIEPHTLNVGISQRGGEVIEPLLSEQWFVKMTPLAEKALASVKEGRTRIIPERFEKVYYNWLENIQDWCISRQLWWGHRIPVWHMPDGSFVVPGPDEEPPVGGVQDPDVLDTWFSSGLWPFSTLGWPDQTEDLAKFYPTSVMETGYDILFFWVARMMMMGCYLTGQEPFHTIYLHGLVRDERGRKMSKSYGNVVNPLEVMEQFGTDALRYTLATSGTPGQDLNLNPQRIEAARNFANKLWNITRFVLSKLGDISQVNTSRSTFAGEDLTLADKWVLSRYNRLVLEVDRLMESYNFGEAGRQIQDFLWSEFADWYVEIAKVQLDGDENRQKLTREVLYHVLEGSLRLLHPFMPFMTEEAWQYVSTSKEANHSLMLALYPTGDASAINEASEAEFGVLQDVIRGIRNVRNEYNVEPSRQIAAIISAGERAELLRGQTGHISRLSRVAADQLTIETDLATKPEQAAAIVLGALEIYLPLAGMIDLDAERARLAKDLQAAEDDFTRREARLANEGFVSRAPANVVQRERDALAAAQETVERLRERIADLG
jgi:valyl-tRNA synthetase